MKKKKQKLLGLFVSLLIILAMTMPASFSCACLTPEVPTDEVRLTVNTTSFHSTSNPFLIVGAGSVSIMFRIYEPLAQILSTGEYVPCLAESWDFDEESLTYTFNIRENAYWHDSTDDVPRPVTADDVVYTFETHRDLVTIHAAELWGMAESVTAQDDKTVKIVLKEMYSDFAFLEAIVNICIAPKHIWEDIEDVELEPNLQPIGSGPFLWKQYEVGIFLILETNENYWGQVPYIDEVLYQYYGEGEASTMALRNGDIDCHGSLDEDMIDIVQEDPNIVVELRWESPGSNLMYFNHRVAPLDVKEVRKAICLAIDYEKRIEYVHAGYAEMVSMVPWVPDAYRNDELVWPGTGKTEAQRLAEANALLDDLGYAKGPDGIRIADDKRMAFTLLHQEQVSTVRGAEMVQDALREIGIEITLEIAGRRTLSGYVGSAGKEKWHVWEIMMTNIGGNPTLGSIIKRFADDPWSEYSRSTGIGWPHKLTEIPEDPSTLVPNEIQLKLRQVGRATDFETRYDLMQEVQDLWYEELPLLVLPDTPNIAAYRIDEFTGWNPTFVWEGWGYSTWSKSNVTLSQVRPIE